MKRLPFSSLVEEGKEGKKSNTPEFLHMHKIRRKCKKQITAVTEKRRLMFFIMAAPPTHTDLQNEWTVHICIPLEKGRLPAKHPLHVSMGCLSVWGLGGDFPATVSVFVEGKRVTAGRVDALAVCWALFVSVAMAQVQARWRWQLPRDTRTAGLADLAEHKDWQLDWKEPGRKFHGGSANTQAPRCHGQHGQGWLIVGRCTV